MLLTVSVVVIAVVMLVAAIFVIPVLLQIRRAAREVEKLAEAARAQVAPVGHDLTVISQEARGILESIRKQVDTVGESVQTVRDTAVRLREFEEQIQQKIEEPLLEISAMITAISRGFETFFRVLRR